MNCLAVLLALMPFYVPTLSQTNVVRLIQNYLAESRPTVTISFSVPTDNRGYTALAKAGLIRAGGTGQSCYGTTYYKPTAQTARIAMSRGWYAPIDTHGSNDIFPSYIEIPVGTFSFVSKSAKITRDGGAVFVTLSYRIRPNRSARYLLSLAPGDVWHLDSLSSTTMTLGDLGRTLSAHFELEHGGRGWRLYPFENGVPVCTP